MIEIQALNVVQSMMLGIVASVGIWVIPSTVKKIFV